MGTLEAQTTSSGLGKGDFLLLPVSADSAPSFNIRMQQTISSIEDCNYDSIRRIAYTLTQRRSAMKYRGFVVAHTSPDRQPVTVVAQSGDGREVSPSDGSPVAFIFTGQGAQYSGMGKELFQNDENFQATIEEMDRCLQSLPSPLTPTWRLGETILDVTNTDLVHDVIRSQTLCTAIQVALVNVLRIWGITTTAVVGHSSGEIAAAYAAGILNAGQAILAAYLRGYSVSQLKVPGAMIAAGLDSISAEKLIADNSLLGQVNIACVNAPGSVTLSGSPSGIQRLLGRLRHQKIFVRELKTGGVAYHSHMMQMVGELYESLLNRHIGDKTDSMKTTGVNFYSTAGYSVNDAEAARPRIGSARYWRDNLEKPVHFSAAIARMATKGACHLLELGPHSALKSPINQIRTTVDASKSLLYYTPTLVRGQNALAAMRTAAGNLFIHGYHLNWSHVNSLRDVDRVLVPHMPPYPWDYSAGVLWSEPRLTTDLHNREYIRHELLGSQQLGGNGVDLNWRNIIHINEVPWLHDHKLEGRIVFPAAGYIGMVIEAIFQARGIKCGSKNQQSSSEFLIEFMNVGINSALIIEETSGSEASSLELHTSISRQPLSTAAVSSEWHDFTIHSWAPNQTTTHCRGSVRVVESSDDMKPLVSVLDTAGYETWPMEKWYKKAAVEGLQFGPNFQSLKSLQTDSTRARSDAIATASLQPPISIHPNQTYYPMHPITIDACLQGAIMGGTCGDIGSLRAYLPVFINSCSIRAISAHNPLDTEVAIHTRSQQTGPSTKRISSTLVTEDNVTLINFQDVRLSLFDNRQFGSDAEGDTPLQRQPCLRIVWKPDIYHTCPGSEQHLGEYMAMARKRQPSHLLADETLNNIFGLLELVKHKNPRMRILHIREANDTSMTLLGELFTESTAFSHSATWHSGYLDDDGALQSDTSDGALYDIIVYSDVSCLDLLVSSYSLGFTSNNHSTVFQPYELVEQSF